MTAIPHPDRLATTLAQRARLLERAVTSDRITSDRTTITRQAPAPYQADARVDLRLLRYRANQALRERGTDAARACIAGLSSPDLEAGTIQDGTARGLAARLEEAISMCEPSVEAAAATETVILDDLQTATFEGKELRRKRDILIASAGSRVRFSRRGGILLVDRQLGIHTANCLQFEDQPDAGCLDTFAPVPGVRPRLFSPAFLKPSLLRQGPIEDRLVLEGQLGRGVRGHPCRITLVGRKDESGIRMSVWILNRHIDHRLRIRFVGLDDPTYISHAGTPAFEHVHVKGRRFLAATLLRACGRLRIGDEFVPTPGAQLLGPIEHQFGLGLSL